MTTSDTPDDTPPTDEPPAGEGSRLVRVTVNLTARAYTDLLAMAEQNGWNKTDVVNRAVIVCRLIEELQAEGNGRITIVNKDGARENIYFV